MPKEKEKKDFLDVLKESIEKIDKNLITDEFMEKLEESFNIAVDAKVSAILEEKTNELEDKTVTELTEYKENLTNKLDVYLYKTVNEFTEKYKPEIEDSVKASVYENLINHILEGFEKYNIEIPKGDLDIISDIKDKMSVNEEHINDLINENMKLKDDVLKEKCLRILFEKTLELKETDKSRLNTLMKAVEFEDEYVFEEKLDLMISSGLLNEDIDIESSYLFDKELIEESTETKRKNKNTEEYVNKWERMLR